MPRLPSWTEVPGRSWRLVARRLGREGALEWQPTGEARPERGSAVSAEPAAAAARPAAAAAGGWARGMWGRSG
eukprot:3162498-Prymnesium_polylepis.2